MGIQSSGLGPGHGFGFGVGQGLEGGQGFGVGGAGQGDGGIQQGLLQAQGLKWQHGHPQEEYSDEASDGDSEEIGSL